MTDRKLLGLKIKALRQEAGMTQAQMGKKLNMARSTITHIENGNMTVTTKTLASICQLFNISLSYFDRVYTSNEYDVTDICNIYFKSNVPQAEKDVTFLEMCKIYVKTRKGDFE